MQLHDASRSLCVVAELLQASSNVIVNLYNGSRTYYFELHSCQEKQLEKKLVTPVQQAPLFPYQTNSRTPTIALSANAAQPLHRPPAGVGLAQGYALITVMLSQTTCVCAL
jgi:hypothetical protein